MPKVQYLEYPGSSSPTGIFRWLGYLIINGKCSYYVCTACKPGSLQCYGNGLTFPCRAPPWLRPNKLGPGNCCNVRIVDITMDKPAWCYSCPKGCVPDPERMLAQCLMPKSDWIYSWFVNVIQLPSLSGTDNSLTSWISNEMPIGEPDKSSDPPPPDASFTPGGIQNHQDDVVIA